MERYGVISVHPHWPFKLTCKALRSLARAFKLFVRVLTSLRLVFQIIILVLFNYGQVRIRDVWAFYGFTTRDVHHAELVLAPRRGQLIGLCRFFSQRFNGYDVLSELPTNLSLERT